MPSVLDFMEKPQWGTVVERERRLRIRSALWAWAYEKYDSPLVSDSKFDEECKAINPSVDTNNKIMDEFFRNSFSPHTGQWVHDHPEKDKLDKLYHRINKKGRPKPP